MSVGDWLNEAIAEQAAEDGVDADYDHDDDGDAIERSPRRQRRNPEHHDTADEFAAISERLSQSIERIDRRLENLTAQVRSDPRPSGPEAYAPQRYWSQPPAQWAPPPAPQGYAPPPQQDDWSRDVDAAVAEISMRQRALDADPESAPQPSRPAFAHREEYAPPPRMDYAPPPPPPNWTPHWPAQDLSGLEDQLRQITEQIKSLQRPSANDEALTELRNDLREIARTVTEAMPRQAIDALEAEMRRLTDQLAQTHQAGAEAGTIGDMARNLLEVRDSLRQLTPAENLAGFAETISALAQKIDIMSQSGHDAGSLHQLESAIGALRGVVSHVASNETLAQLADEVRGLSMRIEHVATATSDRTLGPELEAQLRAFTQQLQMQQPGGDGFGQLHDRIAALSSKLDVSDARLAHLDTIERELRGIMDHLGELRGGGAHPAKAAPAVDMLQRDLSRTQDSVEAVHGTVDHVVDRLAEIEREMRQDQPTRDMPRPVPKLATPFEPEAPREPAPKMAPPVMRERVPIDPSLPADYPLEPGSGVPQARIVPSAAERIAASEAALGGAKPAAGGPTNFIAAARRAAQSATPAAIAEEADAAEEQAPRKSLSQRMRGLLGGAGVILLLVGGYHAATKFYNPLGAAMTLSAVETNQKLAAKALEPDDGDDDDDAPAISAPQSRPAQLPRTVEAVPTWVASKSSEVTGSIPKSGSAGSLLPPLTLPNNPAGTPSGKLPAQLREAALAGDPVAAYDIAMRHFDGRGVPQSVEEAARWLQQAAKGGLAPAQFRLGSLYEKGQGVAKNLDAARQLYLAASEAGNAKAMHNLAVLYAEGLTGKSDYKAAAVWFLKAAEHGVADSQYNLGILYARGIGVEQNLPESYKWFSLGAAQGDRESAKKRDDVAARLDAGAMNAARLAIKSFVAQPQPEEAVTVKLPEESRSATPQKPNPASKKKAPAPGPMKISPT
jgi:localization factor PodJL